MTAALLLIDRQSDGFPFGAMARAGSVDAAQSAAVLPAVHVQHVSTRTGATSFLPGTRAVAIHHGVAPRSGKTVVQNPVPNGFRDAPLLLRLREQTSRTSGSPA